MKIYFSKSEYGSYEGGLDEPFRHIGRVISDRFQAENIQFSFDEFEIVLAYYSANANNDKYYAWYKKLPIYYRGKNMARVTLSSERKEQDLSTVFQVITSAFDILISKKKKGDVLDVEKVKSTLIQLEHELQSTDLWVLNTQYEALLKQEAIEKRLNERALREKANDEKTKLIYDLRFDYRLKDVERLYFSPYDTIFIDEILEELRKKKFRLPNYTHLYIMVSETFENALYHAVRAENWFVYGIAVYENYKSYPTKNEEEKKQVVFDLIKQGLNDIANIDKLDLEILYDVLNQVERKFLSRNPLNAERTTSDFLNQG
ncbi:MAG TPA: hypothetical protein VGN63_21615 [Flavisolibacter sp.]|jgi:hypothetical protein|nr:hypothetical protein [Flavisolibacter sp.]